MQVIFSYPSQTRPGVYEPVVKVLKTLLEKEKLLVRSNFFLFQQCFLSFGTNFHHFYQTQNCRLQTISFWKSLIFVVGKRLKTTAMLLVNIGKINSDLH